MKTSEPYDDSTGPYCWNCGKVGEPAVGSQWHCRPCDVTWFPISQGSRTLNTTCVYQGKVMELVDFSQPGAPVSPA